MDKRVLIVGTVPYRNDGPSRAFESYFTSWDKQNLVQIFSNPLKPVKGHCNSFYQITDKMLLKRWLRKGEKVGVIYQYDELEEEVNQLNYRNTTAKSIANHFIHFGSTHSPLIHLLRGVLWKNNYWQTAELDEWIQNFNPECVFVSFSDDFFVLWIADYISKKFFVPIVPTISDDYYFNDTRNHSVFYKIYRTNYKKLVEKILYQCTNAIYISDKIRDKYNQYFNIRGETVYLCSRIERRSFKSITIDRPIISYFGNLLLDRYLSIVDIAVALKRINPSYEIHVYSGQINDDVLNTFNKHDNIIFEGSIPYSEVVKRTIKSDLLLLVEGFSDLNINATRYSLSTKAADALASGVNVFAYGSQECGLIDYLHKYDACKCCIEKESLQTMLEELIFNSEEQKFYYRKGEQISEEHHSISRSVDITKEQIRQAIESYNKA